VWRDLLRAVQDDRGGTRFHARLPTCELQALIGAAQTFAGPGFLLPTRNTRLFRWCLQRGLRVTQPMTLMSLGLYNEPAGAFLPSVAY
jgi:hypothetical protein